MLRFLPFSARPLPKFWSKPGPSRDSNRVFTNTNTELESGLIRVRGQSVAVTGD